MNVQKGDIGTAFIATIKDGGSIVDISGATVKKIIFEKPSGESVSKNADFYTDGTDGKIEWTTTLITDLNEVGVWKRQGYVELPEGKWHTDVSIFTVADNID